MPTPKRTEGTKKTQGTALAPAERRIPASRPPTFLPPHGGYEQLLSYQKARIVYDGTVRFCDRFIDRRSRTHDQMVQAARSGKQNIAEGSQVSGTSKEFELKLTNVARASLAELLEDYRDYLRTHRGEEWSANHPGTRKIRALNRSPGADYATFRAGIEHDDPLVCANVLIGLIKLTNYLLDRQLDSLQRAFVTEGGLRERMTAARLQTRARQRPI